MNESHGNASNGPKFDLFGLIKNHGRKALIAAAIVAGVAGVVGWGYVRWGQPRQTIASLEFRPTFAGLEVLRYPNGLPFSPNDVTAGSVVDAVFDSNEVSPPCDRETFRGAFFVEQRSDQSVFLDLEYQARLSEPRITSVERKLLQEEHAAKRKALPLQYRLVFVQPMECSNLPRVLISKVMVDMLTGWAAESVEKRGVLRHHIGVLAPSSLDVADEGSAALLQRIDLLRTALQRVIVNVTDVAEIPGAVLTRLGDQRVTFAEVKGKLNDLIGSKLDPLAMTARRSVSGGSLTWLAETLATAERGRLAASQKAAAFEVALREFSGRVDIAGSGRGTQAGNASGAPTGLTQSQVPQLLDSTFIDRIISMASDTTRYRQSLADAMVEAQLEAVAEEQRESYYRRLLQAPSGPTADHKELETQFAALVAEGKRLTQQFGDLYEEFSRVGLRAAGALYEAGKPVTVGVSQPFSNRSVLKLAAAAFGLILLLTLVFFAIRNNMLPESR